MNDDLIAWMIVIQAGVITLLVNLSNIFRISGKYAVSKQFVTVFFLLQGEIYCVLNSNETVQIDN